MSARKQPAKQGKQTSKRRQPAPRARPSYFNRLTYDVIETADALGVSVPTVNRLIYAVPPALQSIKIANRRCVPVSAIMEYIEKRMAAESQKYPGAAARRGRPA